jgi:alpha-tubulin suppressor-like RCC1 family protein
MWQTEPRRVAALAGIAKVAAGDDHSVALHANRRDVYTWGRGEHGQLGVPGKCFVGAPRRSQLLSSSGVGSSGGGTISRGRSGRLSGL